MHNYSNMRNKQMVIDTCKVLPFFKISRTHACLMTPFSWFREFAPPIEKIPPFSRKWLRAWYTFWEWRGRVRDGPLKAPACLKLAYYEYEDKIKIR